MSNLLSAPALLAKQTAEFKPASNGGQKVSSANTPVEASFSEVLSQIQSAVTGKPRTGFNGRPGSGGVSAITAQAKAAIDHTLSAAKSLITTKPKTGFQ